mgnify:FL=1
MFCLVKNSAVKLRKPKRLAKFASAKEARMAESVDALVSNTSGATRAGSTPAPGTRNGE